MTDGRVEPSYPDNSVSERHAPLHITTDMLERYTRALATGEIVIPRERSSAFDAFVRALASEIDDLVVDAFMLKQQNSALSPAQCVERASNARALSRVSAREIEDAARANAALRKLIAK